MRNRITFLLADPVVTADAMPKPGRTVMSRIAFHLRVGPHDLTAWHWDRYIAFADTCGGNNHSPPASGRGI